MKKHLFYIPLLTLLLLAACDDNSKASSDNFEVVNDYETIDSSQPITDEYDPIEIAEILVTQELDKQGYDPKDWEISEIEIYFNKTVDNVADYDKPVGPMRIVWVTGLVSGINDTNNIDLELYKLEDDNVWYIDQHLGVLRNIAVPEMPKVDESNYELSTSDTIPTESQEEVKETNDDVNVDSEVSEYYAKFEEQFLNSLFDHFEDIGLLQYFEGGKFYIKDTEIFQTLPTIEGRREYVYFLDATLTNDFELLTEQEQYELLSSIDIANSEFYEGNMFDVESIELIGDSDVFTRYSGSRTANLIEKNGEAFHP